MFFLVIVCFTKAINVCIFPHIVFISLVMSFSMKHNFPLLNLFHHIISSLHFQIYLFFRYSHLLRLSQQFHYLLGFLLQHQIHLLLRPKNPPHSDHQVWPIAPLLHLIKQKVFKPHKVSQLLPSSPQSHLILL